MRHLPGLPLLILLLAVSACGGSGSLLRSEAVVADAEFPSALAFAPDGRLFYTELRTGDIRVVSPAGQLLPEPFAHVDVATKGEWGLLGLALDPDFAANQHLYVYFMRPVRGNVARPVVMRLTDRDGRGVDPMPILDDLPRTDPPNVNHVAGHLHFGPDGYLYVSIGEFGRDPESSQDLSTIKGKILRVNKRDGSPAPDNPFLDTPGADPRIFAYGLRNSFDFTFHPRTEKLYATDNGPDRCDELNLVVAGRDYGWPAPYLSQFCTTPQGVQPIYNFARSGKEPWEEGSTVAPTGLEFISGDVYPELGGSLLVCEWSTKILRTLSLGGPGNARVLSDRVVRRDCQLDITQDSSGVIYYSNRDEIRRLIPQ